MSKYPRVNFIGNKEKISEWIIDNVPSDVRTVFDGFSGGSSVSFLLKEKGFNVISNDILYSNYQLSKAIIENKKVELTKKEIDFIFSGKPLKGFIFKTYSNKLYFPEECSELDRIITNIKRIKNDYKRALAFSLIRRAMVRKMPYSRFNIPWEKVKLLRDEKYSYATYGRKRAYHNQSFKEHFLEHITEYNNAVFDNGKNNKALNQNIFDALKYVKADLVYLDPPYTGTMNNYFGFYGFLDECMKSKKLQAFDDNFIDKHKSIALFDKLFGALKKYKYFMLSYNDSSYPSKEELLFLLNKHNRKVKIIQKKYAYKVTGKEKKNINNELLFIAIKK